MIYSENTPPKGQAAALVNSPAACPDKLADLLSGLPLATTGDNYRSIHTVSIPLEKQHGFPQPAADAATRGSCPPRVLHVYQSPRVQTLSTRASRNLFPSCITVKLCYCESVKNITVSVPDDVYRNARVTAAQRDTSVSALVVAYLEQLSGRINEFTRLEALQHEVEAEIVQFRAADRLSRDEVHDRAVR